MRRGDLLHFGALWTYQDPESRDVESWTDVPSSPGFKAEIRQASESQERETLESPSSLSGQDRIKPHREYGTSLNEEDFQEPNRTKMSGKLEKIQSTMGKAPQTLNRSHPLLTPRIPAVFKKVWRIRKNDAFLRKAKVDSFAYKPLT